MEETSHFYFFTNALPSSTADKNTQTLAPLCGKLQRLVPLRHDKLAARPLASQDLGPNLYLLSNSSSIHALFLVFRFPASRHGFCSEY
jgi:hypothetical protein